MALSSRTIFEVLHAFNSNARCPAVPRPGAEVFRPGSCMTRPGRSPPLVLGGIQLSGLPWSLVQARRRPCSALLCTGQPFHPFPRRPQDFSIIAFDGMGLVSVPLPAVSGYVSRRRASCNEGGTSPGDPRGPPTGSRLDSRLVQSN
jgi:hypothetical protein